MGSEQIMMGSDFLLPIEVDPISSWICLSVFQVQQKP